MIEIISLRIPACASSVVELWFVAADFPKGAVGADVVTKAALLALFARALASPRDSLKR